MATPNPNPSPGLITPQPGAPHGGPAHPGMPPGYGGYPPPQGMQPPPGYGGYPPPPGTQPPPGYGYPPQGNPYQGQPGFMAAGAAPPYPGPGADGVVGPAKSRMTTGYQAEDEEGTDSGGCGCMECFALTCSVILLIFIFPIALCICIHTIAEYERAVIFRLGRLRKGGRGPGTICVIPCTDSYDRIDLRRITYDVPPQEILTKDCVTVAVDAVVDYKIVNPILAVSNVYDYTQSTRLLAATTLRNVLGTKDMAELLSDRETISVMAQSLLDEATEHWGVQVERVEIKDVRLPYQLQRAMAQEAEAAREAKAKLIAAEGERASSKSLKEAADIMNPTAVQLRYLQTLTSVAAEHNQTVVFPIHIDMLYALCKK